MPSYRHSRISAILRPALTLALITGAGLIAAGSQPRRDGAVDAEAEATLTTAAPPAPEPLVFAPVAPETARELNAAIPFVGLGPAAAGFRLAGDPASQQRATDCLAAAMWYEAGDDPVGERSVGQVVLNRARHLAYPGTVCGVVFQGVERSTGCQFTFTCDGALARIPSADAWTRARTLARAMLQGEIDKSVGLATHYHTDWVHPIWSAQLEKIAQVETHLFFRWKGGWGTPRGFARRYAGAEPVIAKLAFLSPAHGGGETLIANPAQTGTAQPPLLPQVGGAPAHPADVVRVEFSPVRNANVQGLAALERCGDKDRCEIVGTLEGGSAVVFRYERDRTRNLERVQWDCTRFKRPTSTQCMQ